MSLSPNMTEKHLDAIMAALPEKMDEAEITAMTLLLHHTFIDKPEDILTNLIATIYSYGHSIGMPDAAISQGLRGAAAIYEENPIKTRTKH